MLSLSSPLSLLLSAYALEVSDVQCSNDQELHVFIEFVLNRSNAVLARDLHLQTIWFPIFADTLYTFYSMAQPLPMPVRHLHVRTYVYYTLYTGAYNSCLCIHDIIMMMLSVMMLMRFLFCFNNDGTLQ